MGLEVMDCQRPPTEGGTRQGRRTLWHDRNEAHCQAMSTACDDRNQMLIEKRLVRLSDENEGSV